MTASAPGPPRGAQGILFLPHLHPPFNRLAIPQKTQPTPRYRPKYAHRFVRGTFFCNFRAAFAGHGAVSCQIGGMVRVSRAMRKWCAMRMIVIIFFLAQIMCRTVLGRSSFFENELRPLFSPPFLPFSPPDVARPLQGGQVAAGVIVRERAVGGGLGPGCVGVLH